MAYTLTRLQLTDRARRKTDTVNDPNIDADALVDEVNDLVSQAWKIVFACDPDRFTVSATLSVVNGTNIYDLPADFMSLRRVNDDRGTFLDGSTMGDLNMGIDSSGSSSPSYRLIGGGQAGATESIEFWPSPGNNADYTIWYVAAAPVLSTDGALYDCRFDEHVFVITGLAGFICERQDRDSTPFRAAQVQARRDIEAMARKRDISRAPQITDSRGNRMWPFRRFPLP